MVICARDRGKRKSRLVEETGRKRTERRRVEQQETGREELKR